jgi:hypothetical protein
MSYSLELERGYRRLLACYPRSFRRENADEIIGVLLATAAEDQRRVAPAESADLIRGALRMRLRPAGQPPRAVRGAIRLMCVGAATSVALLITLVMTTGNVKSAILAQNPTFTAAQWHGVLVELAIKEFWAPLAIVLWLCLAWANGRGRDWARLAYGAFFGVITLSLLYCLSQGAAVYASADFTVAALQWVIAAAAVVLLFSRQSLAYYRPELAGQ